MPTMEIGKDKDTDTIINGSIVDLKKDKGKEEILNLSKKALHEGEVDPWNIFAAGQVAVLEKNYEEAVELFSTVLETL